MNPNDNQESLQHIDKVEEFLSTHYDFRYNTVLGRVEFRLKGGTSYQLMVDYDENSICRRLERNRLKINPTTLKGKLLSDFTTTFDPFIEYFNSLSTWDGSTDYIQQLATTVKTTNESLWNKFFKKWIVAMVTSLMVPDKVNHTVLVFYGAQGKGKTTWIEKLVPKELKSYLYTGTINPNDKDAMIHLAERMLINLDELENLNRSEIGSLKSLITQSNINIRRPYGRNSENLTRRASFAGSINNNQFLNDSTGSRRFLVAEVSYIDYQHEVNINMVLSQALTLFKEGFQYWFDEAEQEQINDNNSQYQRTSLEEESLLDKFMPAEENDQEAVYLTTTDIANELKDSYGVRTDASAVNLLGRALAKNGFKRLKKGSNYKYCIKNKRQENVIRHPNSSLQSEFTQMSVA
ncbi:VapE domain-containing protein [Pontibacter toksunensis]|uniref:VapE domain-containing protein n=1 Tax=Pontibacter toksunensis TaxID=1332631 RepID=A0ABW6BZU7_9BACT